MVDKVRAQELVQLSTSEFKDFKKVCLTNKSFSEEAAVVIAEVLASFPSVESADLADMIAGRPEDEALRVLTIICEALKCRSLKEVDLSDNALGQKGIKACQSVLRGQTNLQSLKLCNNGLSEAAMQEVLEILSETAPTNLHTLHFYNNMSGDGGAVACAQLLTHCPLLADFRFSGTRALRPGSLAVANALQGHSLVVKLDLADNLFVEEGSEKLASALSMMPLLEWINLRDTDLKVEGMNRVAAALQQSAPNLRFVDLSGNDLLGPDVGPALSRLLASKHKLSTLLLEDNDSFGDAGALYLAVAFSLGCPFLSSLQLNSCGISGFAANVLVESLAEKPLTLLELNSNGLSEADVEELASRLGSKSGVLGSMEDNDEGLVAEMDDDFVMPDDTFREEVAGIAFDARISSETLPEPEAFIQTIEADTQIGSSFTLEGGREMVDAAKAEELLAKATSVYKDFYGICLTNKSFSEGAAGVLAAAISTFSSIVEADLADMIAGRPEAEALSVLEQICQSLASRNLKSVDLSDNALGQKGIKACHGVLKEKEDLECLKLCNNGLSVAAMEELTELLTFRTPTKLKTLHFYNNMSGDGGAAACARLLAWCPELVDFRFSGTRALQPGSRDIAGALQGHTTIQKLDLADNTFGGENSGLLAAALQEMPCLSWLNLRDCGLQDKGMAKISKALQKGPAPLRHLDLSGNELTPTSGSYLGELVVKTGSNIEDLLLEDNDELGEKLKGFQSLTTALLQGHLPLLTWLQLNTCGIKSKTAIAVVQAIPASLTKLELNSNSISEAGVEKVYSILEARNLKDALMSMDDNNDDEDEEEEEEEEEEEGYNENEKEPESQHNCSLVDEITAVAEKMSINP